VPSVCDGADMRAHAAHVRVVPAMELALAADGGRDLLTAEGGPRHQLPRLPGAWQVRCC